MLQVAFFSLLLHILPHLWAHTPWLLIRLVILVIFVIIFSALASPSLTKPMAICIDNLLFTLGHGSNVLDVYSMG
jgi:hypothetical protein